MSPRDRRALLIGGAVVAAAVLALRVAPWAARAVFDRRAELEASAALAARMEDEVRSASHLEDSGAVVRTRLAALAPALLAGTTPAEASADLAGRLAAAAERHRVRVSRTDQVPDSGGADGLRQVRLRVAIESDTRGLLAFLRELSRESAVLLVDSVRTVVADPQVPAGRPELLQSELTVRGWWLDARAGS